MPETTSPDVAVLLDRLQAWLKPCRSALVAYSGGVDSAVVMVAAHQVLGQRALACIGVSPSYPQREMRQAVELAERLDIPYRLVSTQEHHDPRYLANPHNRCYFCKTDLFDHLVAIAQEEDFEVVLDGNNADDLGDDRPGRIAAAEHRVRSPLVELGITKADVRALAKHLRLPVWDKPAMACLSSRVPHGVTITPELLARIEKAEDVLVALGFTQFRVRHHGEIARIELPAEDLPRALAQRAQLVTGIRQAGYQFVTLDLAGFRSAQLHDLTISPPTP